MVKAQNRHWTDEGGAVMVEMAIVIPLLLTLLLGFVDFGFAFYQWNGANKAVQVGARLAEISNPIPSGLVSEGGIPADPAQVGNPVPVTATSYDYVCSYAAGAVSCSCVAGRTCQVVGTTAGNAAAFDLIYHGDPVVAGQSRRPGMVDFFPFLQEQNVRIEYFASGLGFWSRPDGPVPTIRVSIVNQSFQLFFLGALLGFTNNAITMPTMLSTVTGEDLSTSY